MGEAELVPVGPAESPKTRIEVGVYRPDLLYPDIVREGCVQTAVQLSRPPSNGKGDRRYLARGMHPAVGSPRRHDRASGPRETLQRTLHLTLDGSAPGLELPAVEVGSVVVDGQSEPALAFRIHADKVEERRFTSRKGWTRPRAPAYR